MASINMNGRQSFVVNDIKNEILQGRDVTHVLNVKVSRQGAEGVGNQIRAAIYNCIANRPIVKQVMNQ